MLNIIIISVLALFFLFQTRHASNVTQELDNQRIRIIQLIKTDLDFLRFETVNSLYFETGESALLTSRDSLFHLIYKSNSQIVRDLSDLNFLDGSHVDEIKLALSNYSKTFHGVTAKINQRGYKDYGIEGVMRACAHELENEKGKISLADLLTLRRHEKDFLLRREDKYVFLFDEVANRLNIQLRKHGQVASAQLLTEYQEHFHALVRLCFEIGNSPTAGLLGSLNEQTAEISDKLSQQTQSISQKKESLIMKSAILFSAVTILLVLFSLALTYYTSTRLARPLKKLSQSMGKFIVREGLDEKDIVDNEEEDEISKLAQSFIKMSRKLKEQFNEILEQNSELKRLNADLDRFIYSAAHDLKSPLASLDGLVMLAEKEINTKEHGHYFGMMSASVKKLNGFIDDIKDYAKNKRQELKVECIELEKMIWDNVSSMKFLPDVQRIKVEVVIDGDEFFTDKTRFDIILKNLISNSFRYFDYSKSHPFIRIHGHTTSQNLTLTVTDNGIGIDKKHLGKIFNMFYRAVEHSKGTGIGLFLVRESAKMLRGRISVRSRLGEWTEFTVVLPNIKHGVLNIPETEEIEFVSVD